MVNKVWASTCSDKFEGRCDIFAAPSRRLDQIERGESDMPATPVLTTGVISDIGGRSRLFLSQMPGEGRRGYLVTLSAGAVAKPGRLDLCRCTFGIEFEKPSGATEGAAALIRLS